MQEITVFTPLEKVKFPELWVGCLAILVGSIFLVNQFVPGTLRFVLRGWPLVLIGIDVYNLTAISESPERIESGVWNGTSSCPFAPPRAIELKFMPGTVA